MYVWRMYEKERIYINRVTRCNSNTSSNSFNSNTSSIKYIEDSKKAAAEAGARNIVSAAKTHYMQNIMDNKPNSNIDLSTDTLKYDGDKAKKGLLTYDTNGNVSGKMYISGYCVEIQNDGSITSTKTEESECTIDTPQITTYENGTVVYYNPVTNTKCNSSEAVSTIGTKTGCMKWYAFNYEGNDTVNLLLDHNTTAKVAWASSGKNTNGPVEVKTQLESDTSSWNKSINPRLIEASEIAKITGNTTWTAGGSNYYFHDNTQTEYTGAAGTNKFAWLFDNTYNCAIWGCNAVDSSNYGYWTNTAYSGSSSTAWAVRCDGYLISYYGVQNTDYNGIRPAVTISKDILK